VLLRTQVVIFRTHRDIGSPRFFILKNNNNNKKKKKIMTQGLGEAAEGAAEQVADDAT
jgi:hypothetical protein